MHFLVIEGSIGAGKTTLSNMLASDLNAKLILEHFADNPFLPRFYSNPGRYAFQLELSFLARRYQQIKQEIFDHDLFYPLFIADYYILKSEIFAQNIHIGDEFHLFKQIFDMVAETAPVSDLSIYLIVTPEGLLKNIKKRGRDYEQLISEQYLEKIEMGYMHYLEGINTFPILVASVDDINFEENKTHYNMLKEAVFNSSYKLGINRLILH